MEVGMQLGKDDEVVVESPASQASKWGRHFISFQVAAPSPN
jgi:hypothetical protein